MASFCSTVEVCGIEFVRGIGKGGASGKRDKVHYVVNGKGMVYSVEAVESFLIKKGKDVALEEPGALSLFSFSLSDKVSDGRAMGKDVAPALATSSAPTPKTSTKAGGGAMKRVADEQGGGGAISSSSGKKARGEGGGGKDLEVEPEYKARNRAVAMSRAADFAKGKGFKDDAGREGGGGGSSSGRGRGRARARAGEVGDDDEDGDGGAQSSSSRAEQWPGAWSTAKDLYEKRDAARERRAANAGGSSMAKGLEWNPKGRKPADRVAPSLVNICLDFLQDNIESCIDHGLGSIDPELKARLCTELCSRRKFKPDVLPMFTEEGETSVLEIPDCSYLGEEDLSAAITRIKGPCLERCSLRFCGRGMSDTLIEQLCSGCPNLTCLALGGCYRVTDKGVASAVKLVKNLRVLEVSSCTRISVEALRSLAVASSTLVSVSLSKSTQLSTECLMELTKLKNLERLDISGCRGVTDALLEALSGSSGGSLTKLDLSHTPDSGFTAEPHICSITEKGISAIAKGCKKLSHLSLRCCESVNDDCLLALAASCKCLADLDLTRCKGVTDEGVVAIARSSPIERLVLNAAGYDELPESDGSEDKECRYGITDRSLLQLRDSASNTLRQLDVSWCRGISDEGLGLLTDSASLLTELVLRGCSQITEIFLNGHSNNQLIVSGRSMDGGDSRLKLRPLIHQVQQS